MVKKKYATFWDSLDYKTTNKDEVSQSFFIKMAEDILARLK